METGFVVHGAMGCGQKRCKCGGATSSYLRSHGLWSKKLHDNVAMLPLMSGLLANGRFPECYVSHVWRAMTWNRGLCIDLTEKPQLDDSLMKAVRSNIASNGVPYLKITSVGSLSTSGKEKEGRKGLEGFDGLSCALMKCLNICSHDFRPKCKRLQSPQLTLN